MSWRSSRIRRAGFSASKYMLEVVGAPNPRMQPTLRRERLRQDQALSRLARLMRRRWAAHNHLEASFLHSVKETGARQAEAWRIP